MRLSTFAPSRPPLAPLSPPSRHLPRNRVALVPGHAFGAPDTIRVCYCTSMDILKEALAALVTAFSELKQV